MANVHNHTENRIGDSAEILKSIKSFDLDPGIFFFLKTL